MTVSRVQNVYFIAKDPDLLRGFYDKALQLPLKFADGERWVQYHVGNVNVALASTDEAPADRRGPIVVFEVAALEAATDNVVAAGARLLGERDMGSHGRTATFEDPEGNVFQLFCKAS